MNKNSLDDIYGIDPPDIIHVAINDCVGKFAVSKSVSDFIGLNEIETHKLLDNREHPQLIGTIKMFGEIDASGKGASIKLVELPSDAIYEIQSNCGIESVKIIMQHPMIKNLRFGYWK